MYLDMVNEKGVELKGIAQFVDAQAKAKSEKKDLFDAKLSVGLGGLLGKLLSKRLYKIPDAMQILLKEISGILGKMRCVVRMKEI